MFYGDYMGRKVLEHGIGLEERLKSQILNVIGTNLKQREIM